MEEEFEEFVVESLLYEEEVIDHDYEFDAPRFYDFSLPENYLDTTEAEQWFESAGSYPPSPFILKLRRGKSIPSKIMQPPADCIDDKSSNIVSDNYDHCTEDEFSAVDGDNRDSLPGLKFHNHRLKGKTKSLLKSVRSKFSTLRKPTASHLAKQRSPSEVPTPRIFRSPSQSSPDSKATKRQKLEAGYLGKIAQLKHQAPFTHKKPKVDATNANSTCRPKVTIPKQFDLETAHRAQRHKSRTNNESGGRRKSSSHMFKALPLNKKILGAPSLSFSKKRTPRLTEFNVFHLKTSERAMQHTSNNTVHNSNCSSSSNRETRDLRRQNSNVESRQEKCKLNSKLRGSPEKLRLSSKGERGVFRNIKQENLMEINDKRFLNEPPSELFSKLSLGSDVKQTTKKQPTSKGLKENRPGSFHLQKERMNYVKEEKHRLCVKQYLQCMNHRSDMNRACMLAGGWTFC